MPARRLITLVPQLTRRAWEDVAPELERFLIRLYDSESNGLPSGATTVTPSPNVPGATGSVGTPTTGWEPGDHVHPTDTGVPSGLANATLEGTSLAFPRLDHKHKRDIRVKAGGADASTRNALDLRNSADIVWTVTDDGLNDEVDVEANFAPGSVPVMTEVELDFGTPAVVEKVFTVVDAAVVPTSKIIMVQSGAAPTGKQADENEFDAIDCRCEPLTGQFRVYATSLLGHVVGAFRFNYALM